MRPWGQPPCFLIPGCDSQAPPPPPARHPPVALPQLLHGIEARSLASAREELVLERRASSRLPSGGMQLEALEEGVEEEGEPDIQEAVSCRRRPGRRRGAAACVVTANENMTVL